MFDIMLAYQSFEMTDTSFSDKKAELIALTAKGSKCDITFNVLPRKDDVMLMAEYCTALFSEKKVKQYAQMYISLLEQCLDDEKLIKDISVTDISLVNSFNDTTHSYDIPENSTLYSLFEKTAEENRNKTCIRTAEKNLTFGELLNISENLDIKICKITEDKNLLLL